MHWHTHVGTKHGMAVVQIHVHFVDIQDRTGQDDDDYDDRSGEDGGPSCQTPRKRSNTGGSRY